MKNTIKPVQIIVTFLVLTQLYFVCKHGIGLTSDSAFYLQGAEHILKLKSFGVIDALGELHSITFFPPLYSFIIAVFGLTGIELSKICIGLNAFFFGAICLLVGHILHKVTHSIWSMIFSMILMGSSIAMLEIHMMAWSEPLYVFLSLMGLYYLACYLKNENRFEFCLSAILLGLTVLTRYAGVASIAFGVITVLLLSKRQFLAGIRRSFVWGVISVVPMILWMCRNYLLAGNMTNRKLVVHPIDLEYFRFALTTFSEWFLPGRFKGGLEGLIIALLLIFIFGLGFFKLKRNNETQQSNQLGYFYVSLLFISTYVGLLVTTKYFFDVAVIIVSRILSPIYPALIILLSLSLFVLIQQSRNQLVRKIIIGLCICLCLISSLRAFRWVMKNSNDGRWFSSQLWRDSQTMEAVRNLPKNVPIYSNDQNAIYLLSGKYASPIPAYIDTSTNEMDSNFQDNMAKMKSIFKDRGGFIVFFDFIDRWQNIKDDDLLKHFSLELVRKTSDGRIYQVIGVNE